jgi:hypothetical protein
LRTEDLIVTGNTTYALLSANQASISALDVTNLGAQGTEISVGDDVRMGVNEVLYTNNVRSSTTGGEISVGDDVRMDVNEILYTNKIRSNPAGGTVTVYDDLTVLGTLNYTLPPASTGVFGTLSDTEIGDLVTDPMDASPPEAANSNLQPAVERVLSAPTINATQWISTPFLTLMGLAQTDKLKVTSNLIPASKTDYNNSAFWNEGGAILQGRTYIDAECIPQTLSVVANATVGGTLGVTGATTLGNVSVGGTLGVTGATTLGNASFGGTLGVTGATTLGNASVGGTLGVTGATTLTSLNVSGAAKIGADPPDGTAYSLVGNSKAVIQSAQAHTTGDHSGTLMVLDNSSTSGTSGGKGGSVVFAGPYTDIGSDFYGAAGRIRGITAPGAYGGDLTLETADAGGAIRRRMTVDGNGNVGINTTAPAYRLDVSGEVRTDNNLYCAGYIGAGTTSPTCSVDATGSIKAGGNITASGGWFLGGNDFRVQTATGNDYVRLIDGAGATVVGGFTSTKVGDALSSTSGPNTFTGGLAVAGKSVMRNVTLTNNTDTFLDIAVGRKDGTPTAGWVTFDPNGTGSSSGCFFYDDIEVSGTAQANNGVVSTLTGNASSTTSGPNRFAGGLAVNGTSHFTTTNIDAVNIPNASSVNFGFNTGGKETNAGRVGYQLFSGVNLDIVGAGTTSSNRQVRIFDHLTVAGGENFGGTLILPTDATWPADTFTYGFVNRTYTGPTPIITDGPTATNVVNALGSTVGNRKIIFLYNGGGSVWQLSNSTGMTRIGPSVSLSPGEGCIMTLYVSSASSGFVGYCKTG